MARGSRHAAVSAGPVVLLGAAVLAALAAPGFASPLPVSYLAPYHHVVKTANFLTETSGCSGKSEARLTWRPVTGTLQWGGVAHAKTCRTTIGGIGPGSAALDAVDVTLGLPVAPLPGGSTATSIQVDWSISAAVSATLALGGNCPKVVVNPSNGSGDAFCYLGASATLEGTAYLVDETNGSVFYAANAWGGLYAMNYSYNDTSCAAFQCSNLNYTYATSDASLLPLGVSWWINATLNSTHRYAVVTELLGNVTAEAIGYPRSRAMALLDADSLTRGAFLLDVTLR